MSGTRRWPAAATAGLTLMVLFALGLGACNAPVVGGGKGGAGGGGGGNSGSGGGNAGSGGGSGGGGSGGADAGMKADAAEDAAPVDDNQFCVDEINRYRAMISKPPFKRSSALEAFAAAGAKIDGTAHASHEHYMMTGGGGVAYAEDEIPWYPLSQFGSVHEILRVGLAQMWSEGPGQGEAHSHYTNMSGPYTTVGCGTFVNGNEVTATQDFK